MQASEFGNSYNQSFLKCRRLFWWEQAQRLEPLVKSKPLIVGGAVHEALRAYYRDFSTRPLEERKLDAIAAAIREIENCYSVEFGKTLSDSLGGVEIDTIIGWTDDPEPLIATRNEVIQLLDLYFDFYKNDNLKPLRAELPFEILIGGQGLREGRIYTGRIDLLAELDSNLWVVEHKTTSLNKDTFLKQFALDHQITGYVYAAKRLTQLPIAGVLINAMQKPHSQADLTNPKKLFYRDVFFRSDDELAEWEQQFQAIRDDIDRCRAGPISMWYQNTSQCITVYGECPYRRLCMFDDPDMRKTFYKQREEVK